MEVPFIAIDNTEFFLGDWLRDVTLTGINEPCVIVNVFEDMVEKHIVIRFPSLEHEVVSLPEFIEKVKIGALEKITKPKFLLTQEFRNRFTEETIAIKDIPHRANEVGGEYVYYVVTFTPTFGYNYECKTESEIEKFYQSEGVTIL